MVTQDPEPEPYELVQTLREKLQNANLNRHQIEKIIPPSLYKKDRFDLPPYQPGSYKKQCEETKKRLEKLEKQCLPRYVPKRVQEKYLNQFYELKAQGKLSHLSPEMIEKLEEEIKASAADSKKHAELEEFLASLKKETTVPEEQSKNTRDGASTEHNNTTSHGDNSVNSGKKTSIVEIRADDGSLVPCVAILAPCSLTLTPLAPLYTVKKEPTEKKGPVKVASRTASEALDALNIVTEYIQQHDLAKYIESLKALENTITQGV